MNKSRKPTGNKLGSNGTLDFNEQMEQTRLQVLELEYKARYWKAQYEIRQYTLQAEKLQPEYDAYIEAQRVKNEELRAKYAEEMEKLRKEMIESGQLPDEVNPVEDNILDKSQEENPSL